MYFIFILFPLSPSFRSACVNCSPHIHFHLVIDLKSITLIKISSRISLVSMSRNCATQPCLFFFFPSTDMPCLSLSLSLSHACVSIYFSTRHLIDYLKRYKFILLIYFKHSCVALFYMPHLFHTLTWKRFAVRRNWISCGWMLQFSFVASFLLLPIAVTFSSFIISVYVCAYGKFFHDSRKK